MVIAPPVAPRTVTSIGNVRDPSLALAVTVRVCDPGVASGGTVIDSWTAAAVAPPAKTALTMLPPPRRLAVQPLGVPETARSTRSGVGTATSRLNVTVLPGWIVTAG